MGLQLQHDLKAGTYLFSLGELGRILNIPETRLEKAVSAGTIQPLGTVGRNVVVAVTENDIGNLVDAFRRHLHGRYFVPEVPTRAPIPEMPAPKPAVIPGTFTA